MCVGSLTTWCNPNWDVKFSVASPSMFDLSWQNQLLDLALKSPIATTKNGFLCTKFPKFNSRFSVKVSRSFWSDCISRPSALCLALCTGPGPGSQPRPSVLAPNSYLPALAPNLYLLTLAYTFIASPGPGFAYTNFVSSIFICIYGLG